MKIYTRGGDTGETALFGAGRVRKSDPRVAAYGDVDELNAWLGIVRAFCDDRSVDEQLAGVQQDLFVIGAVLATPDPERRKGEKFELANDRIADLEAQIDAWERDLPELQTFILPGGGRSGGVLHAARTVCRRAERAVVGLEADDVPIEIITYLNRLSDFLFVCARYVNQAEGTPEVPW